MIDLFLLNEATSSRDPAPLDGGDPAFKLAPPWWLFGRPARIMRCRDLMAKTVGFYNTVGFNDVPQALASIPSRHDMARLVLVTFVDRPWAKNTF